MSEIFDIYEDFSQHYKVASHYELMEDFPTLTPFTQYTSAYNNYASKFSEFNGNADVVGLFFPSLRAESVDDYTRRLSSLSPNNIYKSVINSVLGLMSRKNPSFANEGEYEQKFMINLDGEGSSLNSIIKDKIYPSIMSGLVGIFVDYVGDKVVWNVFDARTISTKHLIREYVQGQEYIKRAVIVTSEKQELPDKEFQYDYIKKALVLKLIDKSDLQAFENGDSVSVAKSENPDDFIAVFQHIEESKEKGSNGYKVTKQGVFQTKGNQTFNKLPFYLIEANEGLDVPFYSACKKSFKKANIESLFEEALQVSNYPMMYVKSDRGGLPKTILGDGSGETKEKVKISPQSVIELNQEDDIGFLEYEGKCFDITTAYMQGLDREVVAMVINKQADQQTQKTKAQYQGEQTTDTSLILNFVSSAEKEVQNALTASIYFLGVKDTKTPIIRLNTDFVREVADGSFIKSILDMYNDGLISGDASIKILQDKEVVATDTNFQMQQEKIQEEQVYSGTTPNNKE